MNIEQYEAKRQARYDRLKAYALKLQNEGAGLTKRSEQISSFIPFGQPILVGHHSEKRHRKDLDRIINGYRKGYDLQQRAAALNSRADKIATNTTIFSDDPDASEKIETRIAKLEKRQELMKAANACLRKNDIAGLESLGYSTEEIAKLQTPDFAGRTGYPSYALTNNNANIRRLKERSRHIDAHANDVDSEIEIGPVRILDNVDSNRLQIFFPGKPGDHVRSDLKACGFRWAPSENAWQRHRSNHALYEAKRIINKHYGPIPVREKESHDHDKENCKE